MDIDTPSENKAPKKKEAARRIADAYAQRSLPPGLVRRHVLSYLLRNCYRETALAFLAADGLNEEHMTPLSNVDLCQLDTRRRMMDAVLEGDVLRAVSIADDLLPDANPLATLFPMTHLRLLCQHFVELVRMRKTIEALSFAQKTIAPFGKRNPAGIPLLQSYLPLLAYLEPERSPVFELIDVRRRETLAEELNGCVFGYLRDGGDVGKRSELERLVRQLTMVMRKAKEGNPKWSLEQVLDDGNREDG